LIISSSSSSSIRYFFPLSFSMILPPAAAAALDIDLGLPAHAVLLGPAPHDVQHGGDGVVDGRPRPHDDAHLGLLDALVRGVGVPPHERAVPVVLGPAAERGGGAGRVERG